MAKQYDPLQYSIKLLNRRWYSQKEILDKLTRKNFTNEEIKGVIDFLIDKQFIDDKRFALAFLKDRLSFKPKSRYLLNLELQRKGIAPKIIEEVWQELDNERDFSDLDSALQIARQRLRQYQKYPPELIAKKLEGLLSRRGYSYQTIKKVIAFLEDEG
jgi:regulatory protein